MSAFSNGTWHFHAQVDPTEKRWEVQYRDHADVGRRKCFHTEEEAQRFADCARGRVVYLEPRGKYRDGGGK